MNHPTEQLVIDIHDRIEDWLSRGDGDLAASLRASISAEYTLANPDGSVTALQDAINGLAGAKGAVPGVTFHIRDFRVIAEEGELCVATYLEAQEMPGQSTERRTTSAFRTNEAAPHGYVFIHSHETWTTAPAG